MSTARRTRRPVTVSQSRVNQNLSMIGRAYKTLSRDAQNAWFLLGQQMLSAGKTAHKLSAMQAFSQVNGVRLSSTMDLLLAAPAKPDWPDGLPPTLVNASLSNNALTLTIQQTGYTGLAQCWGAPPTFAGQNMFRASSFSLLGTVHLTSGQTSSVAALFDARFKNIVSGDKIALKLYAVSENGFRGPGLVAAGVALGLSASASGDGDLRRAA